MLNGPMEKINNIYKQMGNFIREMKIIKKSQREMLEMKNTVSEMKNFSTGSSADWTRLRKESMT